MFKRFKERRAQRTARHKRLAKLGGLQFSVGCLREYPKALELVQIAIDEGAPHFQYDRFHSEAGFYRMNGDIPQCRELVSVFGSKPRLRPWADIQHPLATLQDIKRSRYTLTPDHEDFVKKWASVWPAVDPRGIPIERIFESDESSDLANSPE